MSLNTPHLDRLEDTETLCLRCEGVAMKDAGRAFLPDGGSGGTLKGLVQAAGEMTTGYSPIHRTGAEVDVYVCPSCGKVELFA